MIVIAATPAPAIRAYIAINKLGWRPQVIVNSVASASNTMKIAQASSGRVRGGLDRDRVPQGPDRPALAERPRRAPLPPDHVAVLPGL